MKVSDSTSNKANGNRNNDRRDDERRSVNASKRSAGNNSNRVQQVEKVERTLKTKNGDPAPERKSRDSARKSRKGDVEEINTKSPTRKKPCSPQPPTTRRPSNPKKVPSTPKTQDFSLADSRKVSKKVPKKVLSTSDSSDNEKTKQIKNAKGANNSTKSQQRNNSSGHIALSSIIKSTTESSKRSKVTLKRQLALDTAPAPPSATTNLNRSCSASNDSLNSITSVTQLLKIERASFVYSSNNSAYEDDDEEEEEVVTGGVKLLAARWQARNDNNNAINQSQNGILRKSNKSSGGNNNNVSRKAMSENDSKTKLFQAIKQNELTKIMNSAKESMNAAKRRTSTGQDLPLSPAAKQQNQQPQGRRKSEVKASAAISDVATEASEAATSAILQTAVAITTAAPTERKISRTKVSPSLLSNKRTSAIGVATAKKSEEFSTLPATSAQSGVNKKESSAGAGLLTKPRSRSTSPTKSGSVLTASLSPSGPNKPALPTSPLLQLPLSRGRSANRRATVEYSTSYHSKESTTTPPFFGDGQYLGRRSRSVSSTPGLPSYAAATATSLAKQTNQIRDHHTNHKEESTAVTNTTSNTSNSQKTNKSNHKSFSINANPSVSTGTARRPAQGQQKNVVAGLINKKNRSNPGYNTNNELSRNKNESRQIASPAPSTLKNATNLIKTNSAACSSISNRVSGSAPRKARDNSSQPVTKASNKNNTSLASSATTTATGSTSRRKREEATNSSASSFSLSLSSSSASTAPFSSSASAAAALGSASIKPANASNNGSRQKLGKQTRIIPSIIMSEYVDNEDGPKDGACTTKLGQTKSLFIPLQFIEPLQPVCDTREGGRLELKVRVKGAEAVVWVKEDKVVPHAPPDIEYFQDKATNLYGLRIADAFLEDSGIYICEAYGAGDSEITCWCQVQVLETGASQKNQNHQQRQYQLQQEYDDVDVDGEEDISWEDLNLSEEIKSPQPLVVPVIVTSQAEQESEPSPAFETAKMDSSSIHTVTVVSQVDKEEQTQNQKPQKEEQDMDSSFAADYRQQRRKSSLKRESAFEDNDKAQGASSSSPAKSQSCSMSSAKNANYHGSGETVSGDPITTCDTNHHTDSSSSNAKRKLISEVSSASDESIYLKEPRSGDEGALSSSAEDNGSAYVSLKSNITNDDDIHITTLTSSADSPVPPVSSPSCSEQNGRSSSVDSAIGFIGRPLFSDGKFPPRILVGPNNIIALYDEVVHLRVKVQNYGIPKTAVNWFKFINGTYKKIELNSGDQSSSQTDAHVSITKCGTALNTLTISHVNYDDCGRYRVKVQNLLGMDSHDCLLTVEGPPEPPTTPPKVKYDEKSKTILIQWSSCPYDGGAKITGYYVEASIVQGSKTAINRDDIDNWQLLTPQSYSWLCYTLTNPKRGSVYRFRVFGENSYGKGKPTEASLPLLVPVLMEGRRAGSSDALLWSMKSLSPEETDANRKRTREQEKESLNAAIGSAVQEEEEEPVEYRNVTIKRESFYDVYDKLDELGKGRFGVVFEVQHKVSQKSYAGKFVKCIKAKDKERVVLEIKIMNELGYHPKLICLIDAFEMAREIVIVTQRINGGELFERVVADDFTLTEGDCITFLRQICDAVRYIHAKNIMHLDLKPENILCTSKHSNMIKIIDFGLAQYYDPKEPIRVLFGTAEFVSPEIINYEPIAPSTDNWSVGVITYILLSGLSPFMGDNDNETFSNITRAEFDFEDEAFEKISDDAKDFISNLIIKRPEKRMTAEECLSHRWLKQESMDYKKGVILPTDKLKRFLVRRKWQKTGNAIRALSRMTTLYSRRSSSASSTSPNSSMSVSSPPPPSSCRFSLQESAEDNVFFSTTSSNTSPDNNPRLNHNNNNVNQHVVGHVQVSELKSSEHHSSSPSLIKTATTNNTSKTKFSDPSRSDSGVCDVGGSFSSSLNYE